MRVFHSLIDLKCFLFDFVIVFRSIFDSWFVLIYLLSLWSRNSFYLICQSIDHELLMNIYLLILKGTFYTKPWENTKLLHLHIFSNKLLVIYKCFSPLNQLNNDLNGEERRKKNNILEKIIIITIFQCSIETLPKHKLFLFSFSIK